MKTIYLLVSEKGWTPFDLDSPEIKQEFEKRNIKLGDGCELGDHCKLGDGCKLGGDCKLGNGCELGYGCELDYDCELGNGCELGDGCELGVDCKLGGGCELGNGCKLGNGCELGGDCKLGDGCELGDDCKLGYGCKLGDGCKVTRTIHIKGTRHYISWYGNGNINIGCHQKEISWWLENYKMIGEKEGYCEAEIAEYLQYIQICEQLQKTIIK